MLDTPMYLSGQGIIKVAKRLPSGRPGVFSVLADCSAAKLEPKTETEEIKESQSGQRLTAKILEKGKSIALTVTCKQLTKTACALGFYSDPISIEEGSVTAEPFPTGLKAGDEIALRYGNVSALVVTDATGTPKTLVKDTDYKENNLVFGNVGILRDPTTGTFVEPYSGAYSYAAADTFALFTKTPEDRYIRIEGLNTAEDDAPVLVEMYKAKAAPFSSIDWISDSASNEDIVFTPQYDALNGVDATLGYFGRVTFL